VAAEVDTYLQKSTRLPAAGGIKARVSTLLHVLRYVGGGDVHVLTAIFPLPSISSLPRVHSARKLSKLKSKRQYPISSRTWTREYLMLLTLGLFPRSFFLSLGYLG